MLPRGLEKSSNFFWVWVCGREWVLYLCVPLLRDRFEGGKIDNDSTKVGIDIKSSLTVG